MHRCWVEEAEAGQEIVLGADESAHVSRVLRMRAGERVQLIARERLFEAELTAPDDKAARLRVLAELPSPEAAARITLVQGLPKADKAEWIIQKATELGVWDVLPVEMERCIAKAGNKRERWERIALEAAKQSGRAHVPQVFEPVAFSRLTQALAGYDAVFVAWEEERALLLTEAMKRLLAQKPNAEKIALVIGPEGGIAAREAEVLKAAGALCVSLGKRILRTETAGLCGLAVMMSALGEM